MSDFGAIYAYALELEAEAPAAVGKLMSSRPGFMPPTKAMREAAEKEAAAAEKEAAAPARAASAPAASAPDKK